MIFEWAEDSLYINIYKGRLGFYFGDCDSVQAIYDDEGREWMPTEDALHGWLVKPFINGVADNVISVYQILLEADYQLADDASKNMTHDEFIAAEMQAMLCTVGCAKGWGGVFYKIHRRHAPATPKKRKDAKK